MSRNLLNVLSSAGVIFLVLSACGQIVGEENDHLAERDQNIVEMTTCLRAPELDLSYDEVAERLKRVSRRYDAKFLNELSEGMFSTFVQRDDPYFVAHYVQFPNRTPVEHQMTIYQKPEAPVGKLELDLIDVLAENGAKLDGCGSYQSAISAGWRIDD